MEQPPSATVYTTRYTLSVVYHHRYPWKRSCDICIWIQDKTHKRWTVFHSIFSCRWFNDFKTFIECVESVVLENESSNKYNINKKKKTSDMQKRNQSVISKITKIFMIITTVFLICSIPKLTIVLLETITPSLWKNYTDVERVVLMFVHQGYICFRVYFCIAFRIFVSLYELYSL